MCEEFSEDLSEHEQKNGTRSTKPWGTMREAPGTRAEDLLPQVHFAPWIVLGCDFMSPVRNIYIQLIRHAPSCWVSECSYRTQSGLCALNLDMAVCLHFMFSQI